jgi:DNA-binding phage protein
MTIKNDFKLTIIARAKKDKKFGEVMLSEAITELLSGDMDTSKAILRDYINATITFEALSKFMKKNRRSVMRTLSASANPRSKSLCMIFQAIQKLKKVNFKVAVS